MSFTHFIDEQLNFTRLHPEFFRVDATHFPSASVCRMTKGHLAPRVDLPAGQGAFSTRILRMNKAHLPRAGIPDEQSASSAPGFHGSTKCIFPSRDSMGQQSGSSGGADIRNAFLA
jgi:hypothetical protein